MKYQNLFTEKKEIERFSILFSVFVTVHLKKRISSGNIMISKNKAITTLQILFYNSYSSKCDIKYYIKSLGLKV